MYVCARRAVFSAFLFKKGKGNWGLVLSSHDRKGENGKCMNGAGEGNWHVRGGGLTPFADVCGEEVLRTRFRARIYMDWGTIIL